MWSDLGRRSGLRHLPCKRRGFRLRNSRLNMLLLVGAALRRLILRLGFHRTVFAQLRRKHLLLAVFVKSLLTPLNAFKGVDRE